MYDPYSIVSSCNHTIIQFYRFFIAEVATKRHHKCQLDISLFADMYLLKGSLLVDNITYTLLFFLR